MPRKSHKNKKYSVELRNQAIQSYLNGEGGLWTVCKKYGILNEKQLRNWINLLNMINMFGFIIANLIDFVN